MRNLDTKWAIDTLNANGYTATWSSVIPFSDWVRAPDPMIHSWRWRQPEAQFYVAFHDETQALVRDIRADMDRQLFG